MGLTCDRHLHVHMVHFLRKTHRNLVTPSASFLCVAFFSLMLCLWILEALTSLNSDLSQPRRQPSLRLGPCSEAWTLSLSSKLRPLLTSPISPSFPMGDYAMLPWLCYPMTEIGVPIFSVFSSCLHQDKSSPCSSTRAECGSL